MAFSTALVPQRVSAALPRARRSGGRARLEVVARGCGRFFIGG